MIKPIVLRPSCAGFFQLTKHKADEAGNPIPGTAEIVAPWFPNLITDQGLERMGGYNFYFTDCQVGSGNATPTTSDTGLQTYIAGTSTTLGGGANANLNVSPYYASTTGTYRFGTGVAAGNISEVGVGWASSGANLFSRALILDGGGSPTTITVLSDEILDVTYQLRVYPPLTDTTGTINISGTPYNYTARASNVTTYTNANGGGWGIFFTGIGSRVMLKQQSSGMNAFTGGIGAITGGPSGSSVQTSSVIVSSYVPSSLEAVGTLTWDITRVLPGTAPIQSVRVRFTVGEFQVEYDPPIPKTGINQLQLPFMLSWSRATI